MTKRKNSQEKHGNELSWPRVLAITTAGLRISKWLRSHYLRRRCKRVGSSPEINPVGTSVLPWVPLPYSTIILDTTGLNCTDNMFLVIIMKWVATATIIMHNHQPQKSQPQTKTCREAGVSWAVLSSACLLHACGTLLQQARLDQSSHGHGARGQAKPQNHRPWLCAQRRAC